MLYHVVLFAQPGEISPDPEIAKCLVEADSLAECMVVAEKIIEAEEDSCESCVEWHSDVSMRGQHDQPGISVFSIEYSDIPVFSLEDFV